MKIMFYIRCYLTETTIVMNCDTDAMNEFSHQMMINVTLFRPYRESHKYSY